MVSRCEHAANSKEDARRCCRLPRDSRYRTPARTHAVTLSIGSGVRFSRVFTVSCSLSLSLSLSLFLSSSFSPSFSLFFSLPPASLFLLLFSSFDRSFSFSLAHSLTRSSCRRTSSGREGLFRSPWCVSLLRRNFCAKPRPSLTLSFSLSLFLSFFSLSLPRCHSPSLSRTLSFSVWS